MVEGVARSLNPAMNMWETARPVVTGYIAENIGPKATVRDLAATMRVLARFGPKLPQMTERLLISAAAPPPPPERRRLPGWACGLLGAVVGAGLVAVGAML